MKKVRRFGREFKRQVVEEVKSGLLTKAQASRQYQVVEGLLHKWVADYDHGKFDNDPTETGALENRIAALERKVGQLTLENDLLKKTRELSLRRERERLSAQLFRGPSGDGAKS